MDRISKVIINIIFISFFLASAAFAAELGENTVKVPERVFSLKDSINTALRNNKSFHIQEKEIDVARAEVLYDKSRFLPTVTAGYDYTYNGSVLDMEELPGKRKDSRIFQGYKNDNLFTLGLDENVYNGGANIASLRQGKINLKIQRETLRAAKLDIEFETKRLFYGLLLAYETRRIANDLVEQAKAHYEQTKTMFDQGTASKFDVLQSKVQVSRLIPQLVNAENAIELIMAEFKKLLSINMDVDTRIDGKLDCDFIEIREKEFLSESYKHKPEMVLKLLGVDLDKWGIEYAKAGWLPQVGFQADYSVRSDNVNNMFNPRHDNWSIGVTGSIAIFDGFATKAKVDEAKARYTQAALKKENTEEQIAVDVKSACLNMTEARTVIESQRESVDEAKEALRLSEVRFENGVGTNLDVFDSEVALAQVEQNLAQGIYDYIMAKAQLDKTLGREFFMEDKK